MTETITVPSVSVSYARTGRSTKSNELGMRTMQERAYEKRGEQYLLIKSPPAVNIGQKTGQYVGAITGHLRVV